MVTVNSILRNMSTAQQAESAARHVLILGIDGARWDAVAEDGVGTRLTQLADAGSWHRQTMEAPTISAPGWASILTGTTHAEHGLKDNSCVGSNLWHHPDILSEAFYRDHSTRTFAAAGWPVLVDPAGLGPIIYPRMEQQYAGLHNVIARDGETYGYIRIDADIAAATAAKLLPANGGFDIGFTYFCDIDDTGHVFGVMGPEYRDAIRRVDTHVSTIIDKVIMRHEELGEDWLVVITTDHGHRDEGGHGGDSDREKESWVVAWAPNGQIPQWPAEIVPHELAAMILDAR